MPDTFYFVAIAIALINFGQGIFLFYKYINGYGAIFPWDDIKKSYSGGPRYVSTAPSVLVEPNKTTKIQRHVLLIYVFLMFASIFILWHIARSIY